MTAKFRRNMLPVLAYLLKNQFFPIAFTRPTWCTSCSVSQTVTERDINDIMELNPGV